MAPHPPAPSLPADRWASTQRAWPCRQPSRLATPARRWRQVGWPGAAVMRACQYPPGRAAASCNAARHAAMQRVMPCNGAAISDHRCPAALLTWPTWPAPLPPAAPPCRPVLPGYWCAGGCTAVHRAAPSEGGGVKGGWSGSVSPESRSGSGNPSPTAWCIHASHNDTHSAPCPDSFQATSSRHAAQLLGALLSERCAGEGFGALMADGRRGG